jgi:hypothetical protein
MLISTCQNCTIARAFDILHRLHAADPQHSGVQDARQSRLLGAGHTCTSAVAATSTSSLCRLLDCEFGHHHVDRCGWVHLRVELEHFCNGAHVAPCQVPCVCAVACVTYPHSGQGQWTVVSTATNMHEALQSIGIPTALCPVHFVQWAVHVFEIK